MERDIQNLMRSTGMDRMQAYYHVAARRQLAILDRQAALQRLSAASGYPTYPRRSNALHGA